MDPEVRLATAADIEALEWLQQLARDGVVDARGGALHLAEHHAVEDWQAAIEDPQRFVVVGTLLDVVLAFLVMVLRPDQDRGVITCAYVEEGARELGLGDAMVAAAIDTVRAAGLRGIEASALPGDRETKNLYERSGLTARKITVYKALPAQD